MINSQLAWVASVRQFEVQAGNIPSSLIVNFRSDRSCRKMVLFVYRCEIINIGSLRVCIFESLNQHHRFWIFLMIRLSEAADRIAQQYGIQNTNEKQIFHIPSENVFVLKFIMVIQYFRFFACTFAIRLFIKSFLCRNSSDILWETHLYYNCMRQTRNPAFRGLHCPGIRLNTACGKTAHKGVIPDHGKDCHW